MLLILKSEYTTELHISVGSKIKIFDKTDMCKTGTFFASKIALAINLQ